jgi:glycosyltransferase involved in cell wall biosynthesis
VPRFLVVSHDVVGRAMAGPGIRYWEIAAALRRRGIDVTLAAPAGDGSDGLVAYRPGDATLERLACASDAALVTGPALEQSPALKGLGIPLVVDWYDPFLFENLQREAGWPEHEGGIRTLAEHARCGDFFVCASERQRDLGIGMLTAWGRVNPTTYADDPALRSLIDVVPFGLPAAPPRAGTALRARLPGIGPGDRLVLWNGGLWDWFDSLTAIHAIALLRNDHPPVRLAFLGTRHPNPAIGEPSAARAARELVGDLGLADQVFFREWTPYAERGACLLEADAAIALHVDGLEARYAFRTRLLDCIWAGLPCVVTRGDTLGEELVARGLALAVPERDVAAVAAALRALLAESDMRRRRSRAFAELAAELTWDRAVEPLVRFFENPRRAADRAARSVATG